MIQLGASVPVFQMNIYEINLHVKENLRGKYVYAKAHILTDNQSGAFLKNHLVSRSKLVWKCRQNLRALIGKKQLTDHKRVNSNESS